MDTKTKVIGIIVIGGVIAIIALSAYFTYLNKRKQIESLSYNQRRKEDALTYLTSESSHNQDIVAQED